LCGAVSYERKKQFLLCPGGKSKENYSKSYRCSNSGEGGIGSVRYHKVESATGQIRRGEGVLFGSLAEKFFEHSEPQCPCKTVGDSWFVEKPPSSPRPEETADVDVVVQILGRCAERARIEKRIVSLANSVAIGSTNKISHGGGVHLREKAHYTSLPA